MVSMNRKPEDYRMPAMWEPHEGTWLAWPHEDYIPGHQLKLERIWLDITKALHEHENIHIIVQDERRKVHVEHQLQFFGIGPENIDFHLIPTNDYWICDNGPLFVVNNEGEQAIVNFTFNGWGRRYPYEIDNQIPTAVARELSTPIFDAPLTVETGFEVNGKGTLLATRSSIINPNRNPGLSQEDVERTIGKHIGVENFIWLSGMDGNDPELGSEETDCHVDLCCRFINESTVLYGWPDEVDESNPFFNRVIKVYLEELQAAEIESGKSLTLIPLPMPKHPLYSTSHVGSIKHITSSSRALLGAPSSGLGTYCGYLDWHLGNETALIPIFGDENDSRALEIIGQHLPGRKIIGIDCRALFEGGGLIHCVTKEQPLV